jgi:type IV pilus assembly protein PilW
MSFIKKSATDKRTPPIKAPRLQSGLSLVELMVSITLGLLIMAGVVQLFASSSTSSQTVQASARIQENIRYIMTRIGNDIAQAGNLGCYSSSVASSVKGSYKNQLDAPSVLTLTNIIVPPSIFSNFASPFASGTDGSPGGVLPDTDTLMVNYVDHGAEIPLLKAGTTGAVLCMPAIVRRPLCLLLQTLQEIW